ncbi:MAG: sulfatase-like hydrolase/transferase [Acidimicrobiia bacterium]
MGDVNRHSWRPVLVICGLSAVALTGPLLDLYGRNPEVFVANRTGPWEIILFGLLVAISLPALALSILWITSFLGDGASRFAYETLVTLLAIAAGMVIARQLAPDNVSVTIVIVVAVCGLVAALHRWAHGFLALSALALPVLLGLFFTTSPAAALIWDRPEPIAGSGMIASPAPIVLIQLDEMPLASIMEVDGGVNRALFPNFARLADEGTWYRNALSSSIATTQSIPAILTGIRGEKGMSPSSADYPDSLFTLLGSDYEMHVIEWVADMCPEEICPDYAGRAPAQFSSLLADVGVVYMHLTLPTSAREGLPSIDNSWKGFLGQGDATPGVRVDIPGLPVPNAPVRAGWIDWVQRIANGIAPNDGRPVLSYAHLPAPHVPWVTNPSGTHYQRPEEYTEVDGVGGDGRWVADPGPPLIGFQRHLYQSGLLDAMLGRLFQRLDETGTWDETMVVVIADHGASFVAGEHRRWPFEDNRDDLYRVPMFIKYPGDAGGRVVDEPAFGIDVLPTIVDVLEINTTWEFDGISLLDVEGTDRAHQPIWWCCSDEGVSTDLQVLYQQVERNRQWVPDQTSWLGVAGTGAHADLIGQPVTALTMRTEGSIRWSLGLGVDLLSPGRRPGMAQTYLTGRLTLPAGLDPNGLLVSVNGRIGGMGILSRDSAESASFQAVIAEETLIGGANQIEILLPGPDGTWLSGAQDELRIDLVTDDGRVLELSPEGSRRLQVDKAALEDGVWVFRGWAADVSAKHPPDMIYVFAADHLLTWGPPNLDNRNVVNWFGSEDLLRSGFEFDIPADSVPPGLGQVTVVAEFGEYAIGDLTRLLP